MNGTYRASLGAAQERGKRLRIVLRLTAPELAVLPWETLLDSETGTYLCRKEPLVRHVSAPFTPEPLEVRLPLRILGLVSSPGGLPMLDVEAEQRHLAEALAPLTAAGLVELTWVLQASWAAVHERLLSGEWHVLHFIGHGDYDPRTEEGLLALVGADGRADLVEASRLADLLGEAEPTPRLVVLNSCSSGETGVSDLFSGTAAALVHSGINAVAAMQFSVSDIAAIAFARGFYTALAHGRDVDEAARSGQIEILGARGTLEWITPVLYVRGDANQLFALRAPPAGAIAADPNPALLLTHNGQGPQTMQEPAPQPPRGPTTVGMPAVPSTPGWDEPVPSSPSSAGESGHSPADRHGGSRRWPVMASLGAGILVVLVVALGIYALRSGQPSPEPVPSSSAAPTAPAAPTASAAPTVPVAVLPGTPCDADLSVGPNTSCAFAVNVRAAFNGAGGGSTTIAAHSPVTGRDYTMNCIAGHPSVCRGGNNATVYIR